ncbi:hypothetical protein H311_04521 [Anncaliia algerae PRA109]|nr:hypothetical protein H311_04521 [Anncaliia algerae PRA109]
MYFLPLFSEIHAELENYYMIIVRQYKINFGKFDMFFFPRSFFVFLKLKLTFHLCHVFSLRFFMFLMIFLLFLIFLLMYFYWNSPLVLQDYNISCKHFSFFLVMWKEINFKIIIFYITEINYMEKIPIY